MNIVVVRFAKTVDCLVPNQFTTQIQFGTDDGFFVIQVTKNRPTKQNLSDPFLFLTL